MCLTNCMFEINDRKFETKVLKFLLVSYIRSVSPSTKKFIRTNLQKKLREKKRKL